MVLELTKNSIVWRERALTALFIGVFSYCFQDFEPVSQRPGGVGADIVGAIGLGE
jgi:hypothetical protein